VSRIVELLDCTVRDITNMGSFHATENFFREFLDIANAEGILVRVSRVCLRKMWQHPTVATDQALTSGINILSFVSDTIRELKRFEVLLASAMNFFFLLGKIQCSSIKLNGFGLCLRRAGFLHR
jgi:hypothetical protein